MLKIVTSMFRQESNSIQVQVHHPQSFVTSMSHQESNSIQAQVHHPQSFVSSMSHQEGNSIQVQVHHPQSFVTSMSHQEGNSIQAQVHHPQSFVTSMSHQEGNSIQAKVHHPHSFARYNQADIANHKRIKAYKTNSRSPEERSVMTERKDHKTSGLSATNGKPDIQVAEAADIPSHKTTMNWPPAGISFAYTCDRCSLVVWRQVWVMLVWLLLLPKLTLADEDCHPWLSTTQQNLTVTTVDKQD
nr:uncharacterized protein LOC128704615 [Cherax quadricarinatus]